MNMSKTAILAGISALALTSTAHAGGKGKFELDMEVNVPEVCFVNLGKKMDGSFPGAPRMLAPKFGEFESGANPEKDHVRGSLKLNRAVDSWMATPKWRYESFKNFERRDKSSRIEFDAACNFGGAKVRMESANGGLTLEDRPSNANGGFADRISYYVQVLWDDELVGELDANTFQPLDSEREVQRPISGPMQVRINLGETYRYGSESVLSWHEAKTHPLLAGNYKDTLTVKFGVSP